jgi:hypothetical protein
MRNKIEENLDNLLPKSPEKPTNKILEQIWGGSLKDYKEKYTSIELQKKALEWRTK